jgi:hypothetical protein
MHMSRKLSVVQSNAAEKERQRQRQGETESKRDSETERETEREREKSFDRNTHKRALQTITIVRLIGS